MTPGEMRENARQSIRLVRQCINLENSNALFETANYWLQAAIRLERERERSSFCPPLSFATKAAAISQLTRAAGSAVGAGMTLL